jgi:hypothetical protein
MKPLHRLLLSAFALFLLSAPLAAHAAPAKLCVHVDTSQLCDAPGEAVDVPQVQFASLDVLDASGTARPVCGLGTSPSCPRGVYRLLDLDSMLVQSAGFDLAVFTVDAGPEAPSAAASLPDPGADLAGYVKSISDAVKAGKWLVLAALVVNLLVWALRKWGARLIPWFGSTLGGYTLAIGSGFLVALAASAYTERLSVSVLLEALALAFTAIGAHQANKDRAGR